MITQDDLQISNKSYTNKDFQKLFTEVLDLTKKLTTRWDPSESNESDPGVVLLKLISFMGDKLNYNIDKNVLECFSPSATQESSMRALCEVGGYNMKYYQSATTNITVRYTDNIPENTTIKLNPLETVFTDVDNTINYVLLDQLVIGKKNDSQTGEVIQGSISTLTVDDNDQITMINIDDNNRIYFPQSRVAENGIKICLYEEGGASTNYWERVYNLNNIERGTYVYKFGYDSKEQLPYVEFPDDIMELIGSGLLIKYIITDGVSGNINNNTLTVLNSPSSIHFNNNIDLEEIDLSKLVIKNNSSTSNGANPETIDEAYSNFKKVSGTFDTLVTCRDYLNAIYRMVNNDNGNNPLVSNVMVTDRRSDYNFTTEIVTYDEWGTHKIFDIKHEQLYQKIVDGENISYIEVNAPTYDLTPYDLCLYTLRPIYTLYDIDTYNASFKPLKSNLEVISNLENFKCAAHTFKSLSSNDIYCFKNYYTLNAKISTDVKVNSYEQSVILSDINKELYKKFNAREVDFGYEIPFDSLLETIQNANSHIRNVSLQEPNLSTVVMLYGTNAEGLELEYNPVYSDVSSYRNYYIETLAKNILAGRTPLFQYYEDFDLVFGESVISLGVDDDGNQPPSNNPLFESLKYISTECLVTENNFNTISGYTLRDNEVVQFKAPNLSTEITYPYGVMYSFMPTTHGKVISSDSDYQLTGNDKLYINYTDSNTDREQNILYTANSIVTNGITRNVECNIIKSNTNIKEVMGSYTNDGRSSYSSSTRYPEIKYFMLQTNDIIEKRDIVQDVIKDNIFKCYWILNNSENKLFDIDRKEYTLSANEYFIYTDYTMNDLVIFGSGTTLMLDSYPTKSWVIENPDLNMDDLNDDGISLFDFVDWTTITTCPTNPLTIREMQILTLTSGDNFQLYGGEIGNEVFWGLDIDNSDKVINLDRITVNDLESQEKTLFRYQSIDVIMSGQKNYAWLCNTDFNLPLGRKSKIIYTNTLTIEDGVTSTYYMNNGNVMLNTTCSVVNHTFTDFSITYNCSGEDGELNSFGINNVYWTINSRLDIDASAKQSQKLLSNHKVTFAMDDGTFYLLKGSDNDGNVNIKFNSLLQVAGGDKIDLQVKYLNGKTAYDVDALIFNKVDLNQTITFDDPNNIVNDEGFMNIDLTKQSETISGNGKISFEIPLIGLNNYRNIFLIYLDDNNEELKEVNLLAKTISGGNNGIIRKFNTTKEQTISVKLTSGLNVIEAYSLVSEGDTIKSIIFNVEYVDLENLTKSDILSIGALSLVQNKNDYYLLNSKFNLNEDSKFSNVKELQELLLNKIGEFDTNHNFYYNNVISNANLIDVNDLSSSQALWDYNNVINHLTIPQIDFDKSSIEIVASSKM